VPDQHIGDRVLTARNQQRASEGSIRSRAIATWRACAIPSERVSSRLFANGPIDIEVR
jgi:hypothetical protein